MANLDCVKKQINHFDDKGPHSQGYGLSSSHVHMWKLDNKEGWVPKNCGAGEDSWESLGEQDQTIQS